MKRIERKGVKMPAIILILFVSLYSFGQDKQEKTNSFNESIEKPKTIPALDKEDGFYATIDYEQSKKDKDIKLEDNPSLTSKDIKTIKKIISRYTNQPEILIQFTKDGTQKFHLLTKENIGKQIAIVIAEQIVSSPTVQSEITGGNVVISGDFSLQEIDEMITKLKGE